jgi:rod shape-determining protein MreD
MFSETYLYRLDWVMRMALAHAVIFVFMLLNIVSFSIPHAGDFKPFFLLMAVYYWSIYRPTLIPVLYVFVLAVVMDLQAGLPVGLSALVLIGLQILVRRQRLFLRGQPFVMIWFGFACVALIQMLAQWVSISLLNTAFIPLTAMAIAWGLSIMVFPVASLILLGVHRLLPLPQGPFIR